jgi:predicted nucleic-acid-binding protein
MLDAGGDFTDGVIAYEGLALGAHEFVSFDRNALVSLQQRNIAARALD